MPDGQGQQHFFVEQSVEREALVVAHRCAEDADVDAFFDGVFGDFRALPSLIESSTPGYCSR